MEPFPSMSSLAIISSTSSNLNDFPICRKAVDNSSTSMEPDPSASTTSKILRICSNCSAEYSISASEFLRRGVFLTKDAAENPWSRRDRPNGRNSSKSTEPSPSRSNPSNNSLTTRSSERDPCSDAKASRNSVTLN
eukprot:TRINITY_DN20036_c0_g1_i1.p1 TRINITY_DN20036_c0_g1~~TRINITY_DN20036_c0_g1_i1.p1  ORF type:complete len:136 (+),score=36.69 TRINITY_DN20036_c0_g1_i1:85-492(+)